MPTICKSLHITGKSHIATGLGIKACLEGYRVLFITIPLLTSQLKEARGRSVLRSFELRFEKYDLIIADELGYISFDRWEEIFSDPVMTAAMIDRLTHKSYIVNMNGPSYRVKETQEWLKGQNIGIKDLNETCLFVAFYQKKTLLYRVRINFRF